MAFGEEVLVGRGDIDERRERMAELEAQVGVAVVWSWSAGGLFWLRAGKLGVCGERLCMQLRVPCSILPAGPARGLGLGKLGSRPGTHPANPTVASLDRLPCDRAPPPRSAVLLACRWRR